MDAKKTLCLIDASAYIHRAFHALPPLTNSRGEPVQALFGFSRMLLKVLRQEKPDYVAVCFDTAAPTFRHKAFEAYKAHRKKIDDALLFQLPLALELVRYWGLPVVALEGYEADDVIATLAQRGAEEGLRVVIVTADKDALQLVNRNIRVLNEAKGVVYSEEEVEKKYGLKPTQLVDFFALTGDASDNVPGVPGVGEKTAAQILKEFGTLDNALARTADMRGALKSKLETYRDQALASRDLVILDRAAPVSIGPHDCVPAAPDAEKLTEILQRFEFKSLLAELLPTPAVRGSRRVRVVRSEADFRDLARAIESAAQLSVDVETTGLNPLRCGLVGIALCVEAGTAWYVPLGHDETAPERDALERRAREALAAAFENESLPKVGHHLKFDLLVLRRHGFPLKGIRFDTLLASYCLNPSRASHGLKDLALDLLGETMTRIEELIGKGAKQTTMDRVPVASAADYAGADVDVTLRLKEKFEPLLEEKGVRKLFDDVEMPLVEILADMEQAGLGVDIPYLRDVQAAFDRDIRALEQDIHAAAGQTFNLNSSRQLSFVLFEKLQLPVVRRTKTGYSTDEEVLRRLSAQHPLPAKMVEYRELTKLKSTYIDALLDLVNPDTGRVHTSFNQAVTATGRLSSSDPNLQNIPIRTEHGRRIRRAFVPRKGWSLVSADYSQIDLRVLAHVSKDPALCEAFRRGGDIHAATAREIFHVAEGSPVTPDQRRVAKTVNFGIVYGQTAFGLSQQLGIPMAQAQSYIDEYFLRYAGVKTWIDRVLAQARRDGYVTTLLGRIRYLPEINAANAAVRSFAERTAMNTPIQGTSADIIKVAMRNIASLLRAGPFQTRILLQVHDDLLFEVPPEEKDRVVPQIRRAMETAVPLDIPIVADIKSGVNWSDMDSQK
jgi:DNA polymerase I